MNSATRWASTWLGVGLMLSTWLGSGGGPVSAAGPGPGPMGQGRPAPGPDRMLQRGRYLVGIMDCSGCHTPGALAGKPDGTRLLAGSTIGFGAPGLGVAYPKNLTPDPETGLGQWSVEEIVRAIRQGKSRDGRDLVPLMPWPAYAALTDMDARAIAAYLKSLPAVRHEVPRNAREGEKPPAPYLTVVTPN